MYECKNCKAEFSLPVVEFAKSGDINDVVRYCPNCMSLHIDKIEVKKCAFCLKERVSRGEKYCSDFCKRFGEESEKRSAERKRKVQEFDVAKAIVEVDEYNKKHRTSYSYGQYFALKGLGVL